MLESRLRAPTVAQDLTLRAKVILASAAGEGVRPMVRRLEFRPTPSRSGGGATAARNSRACAPRQAPAARGASVRPRSGRSSARRCEAQGRDPLERATAGQGARAFGSHRASQLAKVRAAGASGGDFQVQPRPPVRLQIGRYHGALSRPARARAGLVRGRKVAFGAAVSTAPGGSNRRSCAGSIAGRRMPNRFAGPSPPLTSNARPPTLLPFTRHNTSERHNSSNKACPVFLPQL